MSSVSVCGRFDNAPAHIIIVSTTFTTDAVGFHSDRVLSDEELEHRAEARRVASEAAAAKRHAIRDAARAERDKQRAAEKTMREEISRQNKKLGTFKETVIVAKPIPKPRKRVKVSSPDPSPGFIILRDAAIGMSITGLICAIKAGRIPAEKIMHQWYVNAEATREYIDSAEDRRKANARASLVKARKVRFG